MSRGGSSRGACGKAPKAKLSADEELAYLRQRTLQLQMKEARANIIA